MVTRNICAKCIHHREVIVEDREMWKCAYPKKEEVSNVTGKSFTMAVLCMVKNGHGNCSDFKEGRPLEVKPVPWWSRYCTEWFWDHVVVNVVINLFGVTILYLWVRSHGGIAPW